MPYYAYVLFTIMQKIPGITLYQLVTIDEDTIVVMTPKCGTRSLRDALVYKLTGSEPGTIAVMEKNRITVDQYEFVNFKTLKRLVKEKKVYAVYRTWEDRIKSCWRQKVEQPESYFYFWQYYPYLRPRMPYLKFYNRVKMLPELLREKHFMEYSDLYALGGLTKIDIHDLDEFLQEKLGTTLRSNQTND